MFNKLSWGSQGAKAEKLRQGGSARAAESKRQLPRVPGAFLEGQKASFWSRPAAAAPTPQYVPGAFELPTAEGGQTVPAEAFFQASGPHLEEEVQAAAEPVQEVAQKARARLVRSSVKLPAAPAAPARKLLDRPPPAVSASQKQEVLQPGVATAGNVVQEQAGVAASASQNADVEDDGHFR